MNLLLVLLVVVAPVYLGAMTLLAIGLCRAAKRGDELEIASGQVRAAAARVEARKAREARPQVALLTGRR